MSLVEISQNFLNGVVPAWICVVMGRHQQVPLNRSANLSQPGKPILEDRKVGPQLGRENIVHIV